VLFLSRIHPTKNLAYALSLLPAVRADVELHIHGPLDDPAYWARCQSLIAALPPHVAARYHGPLPNERVAAELRVSHLLLLPTRGENFGHVIVEALVQGCPALISDQTPWRGLESRHAGWDLPLSRPDAFRAALQRVGDMGQDEYARWSAGAEALGRRCSTDRTALLRNRGLFLQAAGRPPEPPREVAPGEPVPRHGLVLPVMPGLSRRGGDR
jgi:glycosyltransferase involved in cell wall biosynthesis